MPRHGDHVPRRDRTRRERPIEDPGPVLEPRRARAVEALRAPRRRIDDSIGTDGAREQGHGTAVLAPKRQHREAVPGPPAARGREIDLARPHAGSDENTLEGRLLPLGLHESDLLAPADQPEGFDQRRTADGGGGHAPAGARHAPERATRLFRRALAQLRAVDLQVGDVDRRQLPGQPFRRQRRAVEALQGANQPSLPGKVHGRDGGDLHGLAEAHPGVRRERHGLGHVRAGMTGAQEGPHPTGRHPDDPATGRDHRLRRQRGFLARVDGDVDSRQQGDVARHRLRQGLDPQVRLAREGAGRQALQHARKRKPLNAKPRQPLHAQLQTAGHGPVRAEEQAPRRGASHVLVARDDPAAFELDDEDVDLARLHPPDTFRVVEHELARDRGEGVGGQPFEPFRADRVRFGHRLDSPVGDQVPVQTVPVPHQLVVAALLDRASLGQHDDLVAVAYGAEAMGDDHARATATPQPVVDLRLQHRVEGARGLVQDDQRRPAHQGARDLEPLPLAAAEVSSPFLDMSGIVPGAAGDVAVDARVSRGPDDELVRNGGIPHREVVPHAAREEGDLLAHHRHRLAEDSVGDLFSRASVEQHLPLPGPKDSGNQQRHRRLARPAGADDRHALARSHRQVEVP